MAQGELRERHALLAQDPAGVAGEPAARVGAHDELVGVRLGERLPRLGDDPRDRVGILDEEVPDLRNELGPRGERSAAKASCAMRASATTSESSSGAVTGTRATCSSVAGSTETSSRLATSGPALTGAS